MATYIHIHMFKTKMFQLINWLYFTHDLGLRFRHAAHLMLLRTLCSAKLLCHQLDDGVPDLECWVAFSLCATSAFTCLKPKVQMNLADIFAPALAEPRRVRCPCHRAHAQNNFCSREAILRRRTLNMLKMKTACTQPNQICQLHCPF